MVSVAAAAAGAGAAAGTAASSAHVGQGLFGRDDKAHGAGVNRGSTYGGPQLLGRAEGVTVLLGDEVLFVGFVESKTYTGAAAAAGSKVQADGGFFLVGEKGVKFGAGAFGESKQQ